MSAAEPVSAHSYSDRSSTKLGIEPRIGFIRCCAAPRLRSGLR